MNDNFTMETRKVIHEGFLKKSPPQAKIEKGFKWHKRYFRLCSDKTLEYYKEKKEKKPLKEPIDLRNCQNVVPDPNEEEFKISGVKFGEKWRWFFKLETPERTYHFIASTKSDMNQWIEKINMLNQNQFTDSDGIELPNRSNSLSSAVSTTSSSSNMSSPVMVRTSPSSRRPSNQSASRSRASSAHSQEHYRVPGISNRFNTTPASEMFAKVTVELPRTLISHAPIQSDVGTTPDGYDILDVVNQTDHEDIYKVPINNTPSSSYSIPPNRPVPIPKQSTSKPPPPLPNPATKQAPTRTPDFGMIGYEKMDPKNEKQQQQQHHQDSDSYELSYYPMRPKDELPSRTHTGPSPEKKFTTMPWMLRDTNSQKSSSLPRHHVATPDVPPKREDPSFSEIPSVTPKSPNDSEDPPPVQRETKPNLPPRVDRAKKPSSSTLPPHWRLQGEDSFDGMPKPSYYNIYDDDNTNSEPLLGYNELPNLSSRPDPYQQHQLTNNSTTALNDTTVTLDSDGNKLTVDKIAHINIKIAPDNTRPVPPTPEQNTTYENSSSPARKVSSASNSSKVSYENDDAFDGISYENFKDRPKRPLLYSPVEGNRYNSQSSEEAREREVEIEESEPGSGHYLIVDVTATKAVEGGLVNRESPINCAR
eukprot:TCONS_00007963-protein